MLKPTSHLSLSFSMCVYKKKRLLYTWLVCLWHFRTAQSKYEEKRSSFIFWKSLMSLSLSWWLKKETRCWSATLMMMMTVSKTPHHYHSSTATSTYSIPLVTSSKPTNNYEKESSSFHSKLVNYKRPRANGSVFPDSVSFPSLPSSFPPLLPYLWWE